MSSVFARLQIRKTCQSRCRLLCKYRRKCGRASREVVLAQESGRCRERWARIQRPFFGTKRDRGVAVLLARRSEPDRRNLADLNSIAHSTCKTAFRPPR